MTMLVVLSLLLTPAAALPGLSGAPIKSIYDDHIHGMAPECIHASKESGYVRRTPATELYTAKPVKQAYFINRKDAFKRAAHMNSECKTGLKGIPCQKFTAVEAEKDVKKMSEMDLKQYSSGSTTEWMKKATKTRQHIFMAIFLSNAKVIQHIAETDPEGIKNDDLYLIMEDDSTILPGFNEKVKKLLDHTPADWQVLRLGYWGHVRCEDRVNQYALSIQYPSVDKKALGEDHFYSGNQGYLVRGSAIPEIIKIFKEHNMGAVENAFMYPSNEGNQIISYGVAPEFKLLGMTHDGLEGASAKKDNKRSLLQSSSQQDTMVFQGGNVADAAAFIQARSHPKTNTSECVENVKTDLPDFSANKA